MGEYIKYNGESVKLGTCEDLYYTRLDQLKELAYTGVLEKTEGNLSPEEYLKIDYGFRYRFPFPEEDNISIGSFENHWKGIVIKLQHEDRELIEGMDHRDIYHACHPKGGGYNVNIATPCPMSKELEWTVTQQSDNSMKRIKHSPIDFKIIEITQQKQVDDEVWTVIDCPYCETKIRITYESALMLVNSIIAGYVRPDTEENESNNTYYRTICDRILAGYNRVAVPAS